MDRLQVFEERSCWIKRGLLNKLPYTFNGYLLVNDHKDVRVIKRFLGVTDLRRSTPFYILMHFLPGISLLTLRCFVAEVRWLFPVNHQKKRESWKQRNTEPWWELNKNKAFSEISATCSLFDIANIFSKSSVSVYCLFVFACFIFLLWDFFCIFLFSVYKPA